MSPRFWSERGAAGTIRGEPEQLARRARGCAGAPLSSAASPRRSRRHFKFEISNLQFAVCNPHFAIRNDCKLRIENCKLQIEARTGHAAIRPWGSMTNFLAAPLSKSL